MTRSLAHPAAAVVATLVLHATPATPAAACSLAPPRITVHDVPADGVVVVEIDCYAPFACEELDLSKAEIVDLETQKPLSGEVVDHVPRHSLVWRPAEPLVAGRAYEVVPPGGLDSIWEGSTQFAALDPAEWTLVDVGTEADVRLQTDSTIDVLECESPTPDSCGDGSVEIATRERRYVALRVRQVISSDGMLGQYSVRTAFWGEGQAEPKLGPPQFAWRETLPLSHGFDEAHTAYCYALELRSLIDDSVEARQDCVSHADLGKVGVFDVPEDEVARALRACDQPVEGYEQPWCEQWKMQCAEEDASWAAEVCDALDTTCADVFSAEGRDGGTGNDDWGADDRTAEDGTETATGESEGRGGCSTLAVSANAGDALGGWATFLLVALWRRRFARARLPFRATS